MTKVAFVHIEHLNIRFRNKAVLNDLCWQIKKGEQWLLTGKSGSGKTTLGKIISGLIPAIGSVSINYTIESNLPAKVLYVAQWFPFKDKQGSSNFYYQQRYNSTESGNCATVWEEIGNYCFKYGKSILEGERILTAFDLFKRKDAPLIQLSSGEHKKLQLSKALLLKPQLLILDNPYTGLDVHTRQQLNRLIDLVCNEGMQLILINNDGNNPSCISRYAELEAGLLSVFSEPPRIDKEERQDQLFNAALPVFLNGLNSLNSLNEQLEILRIENINITYGEKTILKNLNWSVHKGEKWLLNGDNGSGKSTLLSLLTGDNPQAYANKIYLFGRKRGTGESIWDIKKQIGFISPELQWYFEPSSTVFQAIASGLFDTTGLFRKLSEAQIEKVNELTAYFKLEEEADHLLKVLPLGKQRLTLLARAIIKNPPLLILDEPCQGLDQDQTTQFNNLVDTICTADRTIIYVGHYENRLPNCIEHQLTLKEGLAFKQLKTSNEKEYISHTW